MAEVKAPRTVPPIAQAIQVLLRKAKEGNPIAFEAAQELKAVTRR